MSLNLKGLRLLVVDNDCDNRDLLQIILEDTGAEVISAASVPEAIEKVKQFCPHVLLSNIVMPQVDGFDLIKMVQLWDAETFGQETMMLAVTGLSSEEMKKRIASAGFHGYLCKPVNLDNLIDTVADLAGVQVSHSSHF